MTVHRAQGQTLQQVEFDCTLYSPGQMDVAVGRTISKKGLRILNYNPTSARSAASTLYIQPATDVLARTLELAENSILATRCGNRTVQRERVF
jgi:hypothetical protein